MTRPKVLIVDDHKVVAEALVRLLGDAFEPLETITDPNTVIDAVARLSPDVMLLDLSMPQISGLEVLRRLRKQGLQVKTIVLTMHADPDLAVETIKAGAAGFALKESGQEELLTALRVVLSGGTYLAPGLTKDVVMQLVGPADTTRAELTTQQREILRLIVRGQRAKEIAETLGVSARRVEAIKYKTMQAFKVHSTAELVRYAIEHRLVTF